MDQALVWGRWSPVVVSVQVVLFTTSTAAPGPPHDGAESSRQQHLKMFSSETDCCSGYVYYCDCLPFCRDLNRANATGDAVGSFELSR